MMKKYALFAAVGVFLIWLLRPKGVATMTPLKSYPGPDGPISVRNNNPFNLIKSGTQWQGKVTSQFPDTDGFEKFESYYYGFRAGLKNVKTQYDRGYKSIDKLIRRLTPPLSSGGDNPDNDVNDFVHRVAEKMQHNIFSPFVWNQVNVSALAEAIVDTEAGKPNFSPSEFLKVWQEVK